MLSCKTFLQLFAVAVALSNFAADAGHATDCEMIYEAVAPAPITSVTPCPKSKSSFNPTPESQDFTPTDVNGESDTKQGGDVSTQVYPDTDYGLKSSETGKGTTPTPYSATGNVDSSADTPHVVATTAPSIPETPCPQNNGNSQNQDEISGILNGQGEVSGSLSSGANGETSGSPNGGVQVETSGSLNGQGEVSGSLSSGAKGETSGSPNGGVEGETSGSLNGQGEVSGRLNGDDYNLGSTYGEGDVDSGNDVYEEDSIAGSGKGSSYVQGDDYDDDAAESEDSEDDQTDDSSYEQEDQDTEGSSYEQKETEGSSNEQEDTNSSYEFDEPESSAYGEGDDEIQGGNEVQGSWYGGDAAQQYDGEIYDNLEGDDSQQIARDVGGDLTGGAQVTGGAGLNGGLNGGLNIGVSGRGGLGAGLNIGGGLNADADLSAGVGVDVNLGNFHAGLGANAGLHVGGEAELLAGTTGIAQTGADSYNRRLRSN